MSDSEKTKFKKNILISGGSRGIGKSAAYLLSRSDYKVFAPSSQELDQSSVKSVQNYFLRNFQDRENGENAEIEDCEQSQELNFKLNLMELNRKPPSYTYQTVEEFKALYPTAKLFWVMGADSFSELPKWKNVAYLIENLEFIVFRRKETGLNTENLLESELFNRDDFIDLKKKLKVNFIENPYIDVSSTLIRKSILNSDDLNVLDGKLSNPSKGLIIENYRKQFRE